MLLSIKTLSRSTSYKIRVFSKISWHSANICILGFYCKFNQSSKYLNVKPGIILVSSTIVAATSSERSFFDNQQLKGKTQCLLRSGDSISTWSRNHDVPTTPELSWPILNKYKSLNALNYILTQSNDLAEICSQSGCEFLKFNFL